MARELAAASFAAWGEGLPDVLDPACGAGALLLAAAEVLWDRAAAHTPDARLTVLRARVRGWDVDGDALGAARAALAKAAGVEPAALEGVVSHRDALAPLDGPCADVVLANPPWVAATRLPATLRATMRDRFPEARGAWDLWVPFVAQIVRACRGGGVAGLLLPDKILAAGFARPLRARLAAACRAVTVTTLAPDTFQDHAVRAVRLVARVGGGPCTDLSPTGDPWPLGAPPALLAAFPPLSSLADVVGSATVAEAYAWAPHLTEGPATGDAMPLLNSGTIDPWTPRWGERSLRYLGRALRHPVLPMSSLSSRRQRHARSPKLVLAGMTRDLEAVVDPDGRWLGAKSTTTVLPADRRWSLRLGAWVHHPALSAWYRATYGGLSFRGGYLRVGPPQVRTLPVPDWGEAAWATLDPLAEACLRSPTPTALARLVVAMDVLLAAPSPR